jgi:hypothetical protein
VHAVGVDSETDEAGLRKAIDEIANRLSKKEGADAPH